MPFLDLHVTHVALLFGFSTQCQYMQNIILSLSHMSETSQASRLSVCAKLTAPYLINLLPHLLHNIIHIKCYFIKDAQMPYISCLKED